MRRLPTRLWLASPLLAVFAVPAAAQNAENGKRLFEKCLACHSAGSTAASTTGPALNGVVGRTVGSAPAFEYSEALQEAKAKGLVWTEQALDQYLASPLDFLPGNRMAFGGVADQTQRTDVIAYLKTLR
jgi:cytochrome c